LDGDLSLNPQRFTDFDADPDGLRRHVLPKAAWSRGMKAGLAGLRRLAPLAVAWGGCALRWSIGAGRSAGAPSEHAQRVAGGRAVVVRRPSFEAAVELEVPRQVVTDEAGKRAPQIVGGHVVGACDVAGQEAAPERAEWHEPDAELAADRQHGPLGLAPPQ